MPYKCDRECFNRNEDGWCKDEWCRNPVPSVPYGAVYRHTEYLEEVYGKYTDTAGNLHWVGTHSGKHIVKADQGDGKVAYVPVVVNAKQKPITNADKIRAMTDEELAEMMSPNDSGCPPAMRGGVDCSGQISCYRCWLDWLKQEVSTNG